ncbi:class I SAM-dependent RNA methyltransferase [Cognatiyoonia sp.]|uniref:class I SAM-dependent RNA methyltransferase n=1 Tax=Cognatiyoonia sp. TaxID=2211652 RepID=UPI003F69C488
MTEWVKALTHHGMGRLEDGTFVSRVLPGELIELGDDGAVRIIEPVAHRVKPPCRHFKSCGGCSVMHASDDLVREWKTGIVRAALDAHGIGAEFRPIHTSPPNSRRRAKFSGRRTKKGALVGFHAMASATVVKVPDCSVLVEPLKAVIPALEDLTILAASRKSEAQFTVIASEAGPDVWVETDKPLDAQLQVTLANLAQKHKLARLAWNDEVVVTLAKPVVTFGSAQVTPPPGAFLQATKDAEDVLVDVVSEVVTGVASVVDLFSGCGTFTFPLAQIAEVHAVEGSGELIAALDDGFRQTQGIKRVTTGVRDLFRRPLEPDELNRFDAAVIDPPRTGAEQQIQTLIKSSIAKIAMVSCNPVTFARDAKGLIDGGFKLNWVMPVDQFRWSAHVELVASFSKL